MSGDDERRHSALNTSIKIVHTVAMNHLASSLTNLPLRRLEISLKKSKLHRIFPQIEFSSNALHEKSKRLINETHFHFDGNKERASSEEWKNISKRVFSSFLSAILFRAVQWSIPVCCCTANKKKHSPACSKFISYYISFSCLRERWFFVCCAKRSHLYCLAKNLYPSLRYSKKVSSRPKTITHECTRLSAWPSCHLVIKFLCEAFVLNR